MEALGKNIKLLRHKKGWSQGDLASKLGISVPAFSKIETGLTDITLSRLQQIAKILDISLTDLLYYQVDGIYENKPVQRENSKEEDAKSYITQILDLQKQVIILHEELRKLSKSQKDV